VLFRELVVAIGKCRFEATDLTNDEMALAKMVDVVVGALRHDLAKALTDEEVCGLLETVAGLCFQSRFKEWTQQAACHGALELITILFDHLERAMAENAGSRELHYQVRLKKQIAFPLSRVAEGMKTPVLGGDDAVGAEYRPYGLDALGEVLLFLGRLLEGPKTVGGSDEKIKAFACDALGMVIERTRGQLLECPVLFGILGDALCKQLIGQVGMGTSPLLARRLQHPLIALFGSFYRQRLVAQFDYFLHALFDALTARPPVAGGAKASPRLVETRVIWMEVLLGLVEDPRLLGDLHVHYESDVRYAMTLTDLLGCLEEVSSHTDPKTGGSETSALMAFQALNRILYELSRLAVQLKMGGGEVAALAVSPGMDLGETRRLKQIHQEAVALFNRKPADSFAYLAKQGVFTTGDDEEIARFLRRTPGLDKRVLGEYLAKPGNEGVLRGFIGDFCFCPAQGIDEALRLLLESFRLPGESQQISRVMEAFAEAFYTGAGKASGHFASADAAFILSYSIVMLNTDQHNPQVRNRMGLEDFVRNNRGINDGRDFERSFLAGIYEAIRRREIVMPEEVPEGREIAAGNAWREVLKRAAGYAGQGGLVAVEPEAYLCGLVSLAFGPLLRCLLPAGEAVLAARSEEMARIAFSGVELMAKVLGDLELHPLLSELIESLWNASGIPASLLLTAASVATPGSTQASSTPAQAQRQLVRHVARSEQCKRVLLTLFSTFHANGPSLRTGWRTFARALLVFGQAGLLTLEMVDPGLREEIRKHTSLEVSRDGSGEEGGGASTGTGGGGGSIFSTFSSYLMTSTPSEGPTVDLAEAEGRRQASAVLQEVAQLDRILQETRFFQQDSLAALLQALSQTLLFNTGSSSSSNGMPSQATSPTGSAPASPSPSAACEEESLAMIVLLEIMVYVAWQNRDRLAPFWPTLSGTLADLAKQHLPGSRRRIGEHAALGLGRISLWLAERGSGAHDGASAEASVEYFRVLCQAGPETFKGIAEPALALALRILLASSPPAKPGLAQAGFWPSYFTLMSMASRFRSCDKSTLGLFAAAVNSNRPAADGSAPFPLEFFGEFVDLLAGFIAQCVVVGPHDRVTPLSLASKDSVVSTGSSPAEALEIGCQGLNLLLSLDQLLRPALGAGGPALWEAHFVPLHAAVAQLACHPSRVIRQQALSLLQRLAMSTDFEGLGLEHLHRHFTAVLLPLLAQLSVPTTSGSSGSFSPSAGLEETQMRAASIICKVWLHNLPLLLRPGPFGSDKPGSPLNSELRFMGLWTGLLRALLDLMQGRSEVLRESIPESIKNMLMVMISTAPHNAIVQIGEPFSSASAVNGFWKATWELVDPLIPRLRQDLALLDQYEQQRRGSVAPSSQAAAEEAPLLPEHSHGAVPPGTAEEPVEPTEQPIPALDDADDGSAMQMESCSLAELEHMIEEEEEEEQKIEEDSGKDSYPIMSPYSFVIPEAVGGSEGSSPLPTEGGGRRAEDAGGGEGFFDRLAKEESVEPQSAPTLQVSSVDV
jgi:brefeldin A-resistance guanine nucleotide exchange factor 1